MNDKKGKMSVIFLFCLIFINLFCINIFSLDYTFSPNGDIVPVEIVESSAWSEGNAVYKLGYATVGHNLDNLSKTISQVYCKKFQDLSETDYSNLEIIDKVHIESANISSINADAPLTDLSAIFDFLESDVTAGSAVYNISFTIDGVAYKFLTFSGKMSFHQEYHDIDDKTNKEIHKSDSSFIDYKNSSCRSCGERCTDEPCGIMNSENYLYFKRLEQWDIYQNTIKVLKELEKAAKTGLIAGSIGLGYNVGTVYSTSQVSLKSAMVEQQDVSGTYDFENLNAMRTSFSYYMNPILGKMEFESSIPKTLEEWRELMADKVLTVGYSVSLNTAFTEFQTGLSEDLINTKGLKITNNIHIRNGVNRITEIANSKNPKSVISYTMKIAYPYAFISIGDKYKLHTRNLKVESDYMFCIYNNKIYDEGFNEITNLKNLGLTREHLFLFYQRNELGNNEGVVLIGEFDECVINTNRDISKNEPLFYRTGRKISFSNGYSDSLLLNVGNSTIMSNTGESEAEGYIAKNVAFLCDSETEIPILDNNLSLPPIAIAQGEADYLPLGMPTNTELVNSLSDIKNHVEVGDNPYYIKLNIMFTKISNSSSVENSDSFKNMLNERITSTDTEEMKLQKKEELLEELGVNKWAIIIVRNNRYIDDPSLKAWLVTHTAQGMSDIDAQGLLNKINGSFVSDIDKITYKDWKEMQNIKAELQQIKDMKIIRILNVMMIIFGVFLILFSIFICLAYWIDIFNTFTDFSFLQFISFGRLYSVESKDLIPYVNDSNNTKYVTFKDVLMIAFICCIFGILFLNSFVLLEYIVKIYYYILQLFGGR